MRKYITKILLIVAIIPFILASECNSPKESDDCHRKIKLVNKSNKEIRMTVSTFYPDSTSSFGFFGSPEVIAKPYGTAEDKLSSCYETQIPYVNRHGILIVFIFDEKVFKNYSREEIIKNKMYLKKYDLSVEDFQRRDWTITYP